MPSEIISRLLTRLNQADVPDYFKAEVNADKKPLPQPIQAMILKAEETERGIFNQTTILETSTLESPQQESSQYAYPVATSDGLQGAPWQFNDQEVDGFFKDLFLRVQQLELGDEKYKHKIAPNDLFHAHFFSFKNAGGRLELGCVFHAKEAPSDACLEKVDLSVIKLRDYGQEFDTTTSRFRNIIWLASSNKLFAFDNEFYTQDKAFQDEYDGISEDMTRSLEQHAANTPPAKDAATSASHSAFAHDRSSPFYKTRTLEHTQLGTSEGDVILLGQAESADDDYEWCLEEFKSKPWQSFYAFAPPSKGQLLVAPTENVLYFKTGFDAKAYEQQIIARKADQALALSPDDIMGVFAQSIPTPSLSLAETSALLRTSQQGLISRSSSSTEAVVSSTPT